METIVAPTTARSLFAHVRAFGPEVKGEELMFESVLPEELAPLVAIVHSGIRAAITGRQWWGSTNSSATRPVVAVISLDRPLPRWCGLLSVEGDAGWDRLACTDILNHPQLFELAAARHS